MTVSQIMDITLWTALITPLHEDGTIDYFSLDKVVKEQDSAGNGILLIGSTGEGLSLSETERRAIVTHVMKTRPVVPIMAGVGGFGLEEELDWIRYCEDVGVDCFLLGSPIYSKPGPVGQEAWYRTLLDQSTKPCMIYNIPGRSAVDLSLSALKNLENHPNFWAVKEASGSTESFANYVETLPTIKVFSGDDALLPDFAELGAVGLVSVGANAWPSATADFVKATLKYPSEPANKGWACAFNSMFLVSNPIPVKCLMAHLGRIETNVLRLPLVATELTNLTPLIEADAWVQKWFQERTNT